MAYSHAELSSTVRALATADKPMILGNNKIRSMAAGVLQWRTNGSWAAGTSGTDASYPTSNLYDGFDHLVSKPSSAQMTWYLIGDNSASPITFDSIAILRHNFGSIGGLTVTFEIADTQDFGTNLKELASWSPGSSNKRLVDVTLDHSGSGTTSSRQYTSVPYWRIKLTKGSGFTPQTGEIIIATRRQLKHQPMVPWDPDERVTAADEFTSSSAVVTRYVMHQGRRIINARLPISESSYQDDIEEFYRDDTTFGAKPFLWIDEPTTDPQGAYFMRMSPPDLRFPWVGPNERMFDLRAVEQGSQFVEAES